MKVINSPTTTFSGANWSEVLKPVVKPDIIPPGYESVLEISKKIKKSKSATLRRLEKAFKEGTIERITLRMASGSHVASGFFYRIIQNEPEQNKKHRCHR